MVTGSPSDLPLIPRLCGHIYSAVQAIINTPAALSAFSTAVYDMGCLIPPSAPVFRQMGSFHTCPAAQRLLFSPSVMYCILLARAQPVLRLSACCCLVTLTRVFGSTAILNSYNAFLGSSPIHMLCAKIIWSGWHCAYLRCHTSSPAQAVDQCSNELTALSSII
jgi:hypothetical protein